MKLRREANTGDARYSFFLCVFAGCDYGNVVIKFGSSRVRVYIGNFWLVKLRPVVSRKQIFSYMHFYCIICI